MVNNQQGVFFLQWRLCSPKVLSSSLTFAMTIGISERQRQDVAYQRRGSSIKPPQLANPGGPIRMIPTTMPWHPRRPPASLHGNISSTLMFLSVPICKFFLKKNHVRPQYWHQATPKWFITTSLWIFRLVLATVALRTKMMTKSRRPLNKAQQRGQEYAFLIMWIVIMFAYWHHTNEPL